MTCLLAEDPYLLSDSENEAKYAFQISDTIHRAKRNGGKLFANKIFYLTPKVPVDVKLMKNVVVSGGGQVSFIFRSTLYKVTSTT